jgi:nitroreductase
MSIEKIIKTRRTIHTYKADKVPDAIMQSAIEVAMMAPNHRLTWPTRFYRVGFGLRAKLADLQIEMKNKKTPLSDATKIAMRKKFIEGGELLIVAIKKNADPEVAKEDYATLACALQNMALYLWDKGFGTKWGTGKVSMHDMIYDELKVAKSELELCGFFWIGVPEDIPRAPERPPLSHFLIDIG